MKCFNRKSWPGIAMLGLMLGMLGCGGASDAPTLAPVKGTVTLAGKPLGGANVLFHPEKGPMANATTNTDGTFTATTSGKAGVTIGKCKVSVTKAAPGPAPTAMKAEDMMKMQKENAGKTVIAKSEVPDKYGNPDSSGLEVTVDKDGSKNDFALTLVQ